MPSSVFLTAMLLLGTSTLYALFGVLAVASATRRRRTGCSPSSARPVSVLKPLCGADPALEQNLESFFRQDHSEIELVFGVVDSGDPACEVVERLRARYPNVRAKLVVHSGGRALNPKIRNLIGLSEHASHELWLVSDSNVRAPSHYVRELVALYGADRPGMVTNLIAGTGEDTLGAALDNVQLNGFCAAGSALPTLLGSPAVIGKSMLFSRSDLEALGGFGKLADLLAEDFVLGQMFRTAGYEVRIAPTVIECRNHRLPIGGFLARHLRWTMLRLHLVPVVTLFEPLASPLLLLPLAWAAVGPAALAWTLAVWWLRDGGGWLLLRGPRRAWIPLLLAPLRDLGVLAAWAAALFTRHVSWRGTRLRIASGTLLLCDAPSR